MRVVLSLQARQDLGGQLDYLIRNNAAKPARVLKSRVMLFLRTTLASYPRIGLAIEHRGLYECWIPGTRIVVWYRIQPDAIEVARLWHASQDRQSAP